MHYMHEHRAMNKSETAELIMRFEWHQEPSSCTPPAACEGTALIHLPEWVAAEMPCLRLSEKLC